MSNTADSMTLSSKVIFYTWSIIFGIFWKVKIVWSDKVQGASQYDKGAPSTSQISLSLNARSKLTMCQNAFKMTVFHEIQSSVEEPRRTGGVIVTPDSPQQHVERLLVCFAQAVRNYHVGIISTWPFLMRVSISGHL